MYELADDGEGVKEVPIPKSVKKAGVIPEGYSVGAYLLQFMTAITELMVGVWTGASDFVVDPATIVKSLAKQGLVTEGYVRPFFRGLQDS